MARKARFRTGTYVYGDFCSGEIFGWNGSTQSVLLDTTMSISSFGEDEAGEMLVMSLGGSVSRIASTAPPCTLSISPTSKSSTRRRHGQRGGQRRRRLNWTAVSNVSWITVTGGSSGTGSGTVNY